MAGTGLLQSQHDGEARAQHGNAHDHQLRWPEALEDETDGDCAEQADQ